MTRAIVENLEVNKQAEERSKVLQMSKGLNAFVEGKTSLDTGNRYDGDYSYGPINEVADDTKTAHTNIEGAHKATFSRAANLLSDSLNFRTHGGVCFLETMAGSQSMAVWRTAVKVLETESDSDAKDSSRMGPQSKGMITVYLAVNPWRSTRIPRRRKFSLSQAQALHLWTPFIAQTLALSAH
ncbi:MAG: hypothetical protein Q9201_003878 [Fulgogasparrea decipioides]